MPLFLYLYNSCIYLSRMVTDPPWIRAVLQNQEIPVSALAVFKATRTSVITKWPMLSLVTLWDLLLPSEYLGLSPGEKAAHKEQQRLP
jgi:hypothetical protein